MKVTYIDHHDLEGLSLLELDHNLPATVHSAMQRHPRIEQRLWTFIAPTNEASLSLFALALPLSSLSLYSHSETFTPLKGSG